MSFTEQDALRHATLVGAQSPCAKSKRGVVVFLRDRTKFEDPGEYSVGTNEPPWPMACDGSEACRANCNKLCVHAEASALLNLIGQEPARPPAPTRLDEFEMLHVKVVGGVAVPSGPPSCPYCSRLILKMGLKAMWLLHEDGLRSYTAEEFHRLTLEHCGLPIIEQSYSHVSTSAPKEGTQIVETLPDACPTCGKGMLQGYGLAGGGMGAWAVCEETCPITYKVLDPADD